MGDTKTPTAPQLPKDVPEDIRLFVECKKLTVTIQNGKVPWLPLPDDVKKYLPDSVKPELSITPGSKPGTATIKLGLGPISVSLPASVSDGTLSVDTSDVGMLVPDKLVDGINQAVKDLNDWFKHKGHGFGPPKFGEGQVTLSKIDIAAPGKAEPTPTPATTEPKPTPKPAEPPATGKAPEPGDAGYLETIYVEQPTLPTQEVFTPKPATTGPKPLVGAGGPGGPKAPMGLGDMAVRVVVIAISLAVIGAAIFVGGPALGLFGAAGPTASPTAVASPTPTPVPTPTPTPAPVTVISDDGLASLTIPYGSVPADTQFSVSALGQADAPPELEGVTFRSAFYRIEPTDVTLSGPLSFQRTVDLAALGIDPEGQGYPLIQLAGRAPSGQWWWLGNQGKLVGGIDGTADESRPVMTADLTALGDVFGFGRSIYLLRDPYPENATFGVGQPIMLGARINGANGAPLAPQDLPTIANVGGYFSPGYTPWYVDPFVLRAPDGVLSAGITATCRQPGDTVIGLQLDVTPAASTDLLDSLGLGTAPTTTVSWTTVVHCVEGASLLQPILGQACVEVIHQPLGDDPSFLRWSFGFSQSSVIPGGSTIQLSYREGASAPLRTFRGFPIANYQAVADTGISSYGAKVIEDISAVGIDQAAVSLYQAWRQFGGEEILDVTSQEEVISGTCPKF